MEQNLAIFENEQFGKIRVLTKDGEPWFVAKDVCKCLNIKNHNDVVSSLYSSEKDGVGITDRIGRTQQMTIISESGFYKLVLKSRKPEARRFQDWVTQEVLPSIRKTGTYSITQNNQILNAIETLSLQNQELNKKIDTLGTQVQEMIPKVQFYDAITQSSQTYDIGETAKILGKCGRNTLFKILKQKRILMSNRTPYQKFINNGTFQVVIDEGSFYSKPVVTGKGLQFINKILD